MPFCFLFQGIRSVMVNGQTLDIATLITHALMTNNTKFVKNFLSSMPPDWRSDLNSHKSATHCRLQWMLKQLPSELRRLLDWAKEVPADVYFLPSKPVLLIICCKEDRRGADEELESLRRLERVFHIHILIDPTEEETMAKIRQIQYQHERSACFVVAMAHGVRGYIRVKDKLMSIRDLVLQMTPPYLNTVPKVSHHFRPTSQRIGIHVYIIQG